MTNNMANNLVNNIMNNVYNIMNNVTFDQKRCRTCRIYIPRLILFWSILLIYILASSLVNGESDPDSHKLDERPFFAHSFKMQINAYQEECVWQKLKQGTYLSFGYEVLRGGDRKIAFVMRDNQGGVLESQEDKEDYFLDKTIENEGVYGFCMDNRDGKLVEKLIFFYLSGYLSQSWDLTQEEAQQYDEKAQNISNAIMSVDLQIQKMINHQTVNRMHLTTDWYLISGNLNWVTYWSGFQSVVIALVGVVQVFCIKRLFADDSSGGSGLIRAST